MSDISTIIQTLNAGQGDVAQQAMQVAILRQQAQADQAVVTLLQQGNEQMQAVLPAGQGQNLDITA